MTAVTTSRPTGQSLIRAGEHSGRRWPRTVLAALLTGVLYPCLVLVGVIHAASALITGASTDAGT